MPDIVLAEQVVHLSKSFLPVRLDVEDLSAEVVGHREHLKSPELTLVLLVLRRLAQRLRELLHGRRAVLALPLRQLQPLRAFILPLLLPVRPGEGGRPIDSPDALIISTQIDLLLHLMCKRVHRAVISLSLRHERRLHSIFRLYTEWVQLLLPLRLLVVALADLPQGLDRLCNNAISVGVLVLDVARPAAEQRDLLALRLLMQTGTLLSTNQRQAHIGKMDVVRVARFESQIFEIRSGIIIRHLIL